MPKRRRNIRISGKKPTQSQTQRKRRPARSRPKAGSSYQPFPSFGDIAHRQLRPGNMAPSRDLAYGNPRNWADREAAVGNMIEGHRLHASSIVTDFVNLLTTEIKSLDRPSEVSNQDVIAAYLDKATSTLSNWKTGHRSQKIRGVTERVESTADFPSLLVMKILTIAIRDPKRLYKIFFQKDMNDPSHVEELVRAYSQGAPVEHCANLAQIVAASFVDPEFEKHPLDILEDIIQAPVVEQ
jgi:hypothetical protein